MNELPCSTQYLRLTDSSLKNTSNDEPQPSSDAGKKDDEGVNNESGIDDQERPGNSPKDVNTGSLNINTVSPTITAAPLEATHVDFFGDETKIDMSNITTTYLVPSTPNTRIHKDHSLDHVIGDVQSGVQTRRMTKTINEQGFISVVYEGKIHEDLYTRLFACFLSQEGPKKVYRNKKDERGIVIRNKARLVAQGYTQEERINYDDVFAPVARIEAIRLFLAYPSFKDFVVYQMDVKSAFLYGNIEEEVYVCQPLGFEDPEFPDRVYKVEKALYGLHQAPRAWYETLSTYLLDNGFYQILVNTLKFPLLRAVKRIFRYLKGQPKLGLWYPKDSPFDLEAYTDSDYASASLDKKSTTGVKNPVFHLKTKHIEIRHRFIRDSNKKKLIQMIKIHTYQNVADLLTKAFDVSIFQYMITSIGLLLTSDVLIEGRLNCVNMQADDAKWMLEMNVIALMINSRLVCWPISTVILDKQLKNDQNKEIYVTPSHTRRLGEGSEIPTAHLTQSTIISTIAIHKPQMTTTGGKQGKTLKPSGSTEPITDEAANEEHVPIHSNDPLLSGEDRLKLNELMEICTNLSKRVLDLENTKTTQAAIAKLKERVKKL
ncbi:putative ribonuclease H-like domain-containing protein [Tanacetum coccineum]